jgi:hypothetical protein
MNPTISMVLFARNILSSSFVLYEIAWKTKLLKSEPFLGLLSSNSPHLLVHVVLGIKPGCRDCGAAWLDAPIRG